MKMNKDTLYSKEYEHDSCGVGFVANIKGKTSHSIIEDGITILKNLIHRGAVGSAFELEVDLVLLAMGIRPCGTQ